MALRTPIKLSIVFGLILFALVAYSVRYRGSLLAPGLSKERLRTVSPGMRSSDVLQILGSPLERDGDNWIYGKQGSFGAGHEVYVTMKSGLVDRIAVERYDLGVYWQDAGHAAVTNDARAFNCLP